MLKKIIPKPIKIRLRRFKESFDFQKLESIPCKTDSLGKIKQNKLDEILSSKSYDNDYNRLSKIINPLDLPENTGGINLGDQRAIFYLTKGFSFKSILEIGTHIGCSTLHFSLALNESKHKNKVLDTVDIKDVNNEEKKEWKKYGSKYSPRRMIELAQSSHFVNFIHSNSISYLTNCNKRYDLIFLDGSHLANIVYQELPLALRLLNKGGLILLHDYYPNNKPLWNNKTIIPGPYNAIKRFIEEGQNFNVIPLGILPWKTKMDSNKTSLALLSK